MPERYGSCKTAYDRLGRWQRNGTWDRVLATLRLKADGKGLLDYSQYNTDATNIRATRAAGGAVKKGPQALGMTRGGFGSKVHLMTEARG